MEFFFFRLCPSHSCCRGVKSISGGLIKGCLLEKHSSESLSATKPGSLSFFFFNATVVVLLAPPSKRSTSSRFCWCDFRWPCQATMSPVSSEGDPSQRLVLNNNPVSKDTPGTETIDRCDGREVAARWNFTTQPTSTASLGKHRLREFSEPF